MDKTKFTKEPLVVTDGNKEKIVVDLRMIKRASLTLRALNHPLRRKLIELMEQNPGITVTELYRKLKIEQSVASQHLAILRRAAVAITKREGKKILYSPNAARIREVAELAKPLAQELDF